MSRLETEALFTGKYDKESAVLSVYSGAGGEDAEDWANMLARMYVKYCENRGFKTRMIEDKIIEISGSCAYGYLKNETGVHRLVRISPFSAKQLRHTSFALVEVVPDLARVEKNWLFPPMTLK